MANRPRAHYDYTKAGVLMLTLRVRRPYRLCEIGQTSFTVLPLGRMVQGALLGIHEAWPQVKIGQYQIMPDHLHVIVHVVGDLPPDKSIRQIFAAFKVEVLHRAQAAQIALHGGIFEEGLYDRIIPTRDHLEREVAYVRDNVRRYRALKANAGLFQQPQRIVVRGAGGERALWAIGNGFLLGHPCRKRVRLSRSLGEGEWAAIAADTKEDVERGCVFVSPFISPFEQRVLRLVLEAGGRVVQVTHEFFGEHYKPHGICFDAFCEGRVLEVSAAGEFERYAKLDRAMCLRMNEIARGFSTR